MRFAALLSLFLVSVAVFWALRPLRLRGGDTELYLGIYGVSFSSNQWMYHVREPGAVWLLQLAVGATGARLGSPRGIAPAFELLSILSGGVFAVAAWEFARAARSSARVRAVVFAAAFAGIYTLTFAGHIELYAPLTAALMLLCMLAALHCAGRVPQIWVWAGLAVAATVHRAALFTLPAFWALRAPVPDPHWWRRDPALLKGFVFTVLAVAVPHIVIELGSVLSLHGHGLSWWPVPMEVTNWLPELVTPLTQSQADYVRANSQMGSFHLFTLGSREHWRHFLFFVLTAAPWGAPVVLLLARRVETRLEKFLAGAATGGWLWAFVWHPHQSFGDWDLFSSPGLATNLLAALLFTKGGRGGYRGAAGDL